MIAVGKGPVITDVARTRVYFLVQGWDGRTVAHDSWNGSDAQPEPIPEALRGVIDLGGPRPYPVGTVVEVVVPKDANLFNLNATAVVLYGIASG